MASGFAPMVSADFSAALDLALYEGILQKPVNIKPLRQQLFEAKSSVQNKEKFARFSGWGLFGAKPVGGQPQGDKASQMYEKFIKFATYGKRMDIVFEALDDDPKRIINRIWDMGSMLRSTFEYTVEQLHWSFLNTHWSATTSGAFYNMNSTDYPWFSTVHPTANPGQTYSNRFANPTQLNRAMLEKAVELMEQQNLNPRGLKQLIDPSTLIIGTGNWANAGRLIRAMSVPESADNGPNMIRDYIRKRVNSPLFANDGRWAITGNKEEIGLASFMRLGLKSQEIATNPTLNRTRVCVFRVGYGGLYPDGAFASVAA